MKTLAGIKRRINAKEPVIMTWHKNGASKLVGMVRRAEKVQSNAVMFEGGSWLYWNKASDYRIDGPDSFTVFSCGAPLMSYKFVQD